MDEKTLKELVDRLRNRAMMAVEQAKKGPGYLEGRADGLMDAARELENLLKKPDESKGQV